MAPDHPVCLDLTQEIEHLLCPSHRERGNHHIAPLVKGSLQDPRQLANVIRMFRTVQPVSVCGFHNHIICVIRKLRILD